MFLKIKSRLLRYREGIVVVRTTQFETKLGEFDYTKQYDDGRADVTPKPNQRADERRTSFKIAQVSTKFGVENI